MLGDVYKRQDQYAAAFGGVNSIRFGSGGVEIESLRLSAHTMKRLGEELTLVFTGLSRSASEVLSEAPDDPADKLDRLRAIRIQADEARETLESGDLSGLGNLLSGAWEANRGSSAGGSVNDIDALHTRIMSMGATGAKLLGAGGGGFFLVHGEGGLRARLAELGPEHRIIPLGIDHIGSTIIHED